MGVKKVLDGEEERFYDAGVEEGAKGFASADELRKKFQERVGKSGMVKGGDPRDFSAIIVAETMIEILAEMELQTEILCSRPIDVRVVKDKDWEAHEAVS